MRDGRVLVSAVWSSFTARRSFVQGDHGRKIAIFFLLQVLGGHRRPLHLGPQAVVPAVYRPTNLKKDGTFRNIRVEAFQSHGRDKLVVRTRPGYFALKPAEPAAVAAK